MAFSRWNNETENDFIDIIQNIDNHRDWFAPYTDPLNGENLPYSIDKIFRENQKITLNGNEITYNAFEFSEDKPVPGEEENRLRSSRITSKSSFILLFTDGNNTQFIIDKSGSNAKSIIRKLNNYTERNEINESPYHISNDLSDWLVYMLIEKKDEALDEETNFTLDSIVGFKGSADGQRLAEVTGSGNRIMNALSTLAFLLESEEFSYLKPRLTYQSHTTELSLIKNGTIDVKFERYAGEFIEEDISMKARVLLLVSIEILPKLVAKYAEYIENGDWNANVKAQMLRRIGNTIQEKVTDKIEKLIGNENQDTENSIGTDEDSEE